MGCAHREYEICNECNERITMERLQAVTSMEDLKKSNQALQQRLRDYARQNLYYIKSLKHAEERNARQRRDLKKMKEAYLENVGPTLYYSRSITTALDGVVLSVQGFFRAIVRLFKKPSA